MKICFLMERGSPPRLNPVFAELAVLLEARATQVSFLYPEQELLRLDTLSVEADLYLLKSDTEMAFSLAAALEGLGARVLNAVGPSTFAKDKVMAASLLLREGIPTPRSLAAAVPHLLATELENGPLIFKPHRGYHGVGIAVAEGVEGLPSEGAYPGLVFAQSYFGSARKDLKIFAIGETIFGVRKPFSPESFLQAGRPIPLSPEMEEIARRCGKCFGLALYGLDLVEEEAGVFVVDVNPFPGYRGVPEAPRLLADHLLRAGRG
ncbi:MAG: hypothetical protein WBK96_14250 [Candidatus Manganitrophaceae bacterium]